ncbi:MAG: succinylglutamate desuccinylase/aspartoacylase family protein, partial [Oscillospiraceae bacterium]|nr:succinylglutamate desuccinylase/aspartoacylase family protein [Oscillospiraceae bacterium]
AEQPPERETSPAEAPAALPEDPALWTLADFAPALCAADAAEERYAIAAGTEWENEVVVRRGAAEGPAVYIVGGIHGDETAGWTAANLLKTVCPDAGTVYLLSPANRYGAENDRRTTRSMRDLNRCFPGKSDGWDAEQIAASIYADIADKQPALVLDLHETKGPQASAPERDDLRGSVIVCDVAPVADLIWDLTVDGAWTLLGSPPAGSINRTVSEELGIPVLTLETWRADALSVRVAQQLRFVRAVLDFCGVLSGQ